MLPPSAGEAARTPRRTTATIEIERRIGAPPNVSQKGGLAMHRRSGESREYLELSIQGLGSVVGRDQLDDEPLLLLAANGDDRLDDYCAAGDGDAISDLDCVIVGLVTGRDDLIATSELIEIGDWRHPGRKPRDSGGGRAPDKPAYRNAQSHLRASGPVSLRGA